VDGVLRYGDSRQTGDSLGDGGALVFGQDQDSVGGGFDSAQALLGLLDDVRIYDRVLSLEEVQALYDLGQ
jgi:hypothetical protein